MNTIALKIGIAALSLMLCACGEDNVSVTVGLGNTEVASLKFQLADATPTLNKIAESEVVKSFTDL